MLVGALRRFFLLAPVLHLTNRHSNRLSCVVVDEACRTFEHDIARVLVDIEFAERLQRVMAGALPLDGKFIAPAPPKPYSFLLAFGAALSPAADQTPPLPVTPRL